MTKYILFYIFILLKHSLVSVTRYLSSEQVTQRKADSEVHVAHFDKSHSIFRKINNFNFVQFLYGIYFYLNIFSNHYQIFYFLGRMYRSLLLPHKFSISINHNFYKLNQHIILFHKFDINHWYRMSYSFHDTSIYRL